VTATDQALLEGFAEVLNDKGPVFTPRRFFFLVKHLKSDFFCISCQEIVGKPTDNQGHNTIKIEKFCISIVDGFIRIVQSGPLNPCPMTEYSLADPACIENLVVAVCKILL
jgi:hypothetical protein